MPRFDMNGVVNTTLILKVFDATDNPNYYNLDGTQPTVEGILTGFTLTVDVACKVEIGVTNVAKSSFTPVYTTYATYAAAGGIVRELKKNAYPLPFDHASINLLAIRLTTAASATVRVAGDIDFSILGARSIP